MTAQRWDDGYVAITDRDGDGLQLEPVVEQVVGEQPFVAVLHALKVEQTVVTVGLTFDDGLVLLQALAAALKVERCTHLTDPGDRWADHAGHSRPAPWAKGAGS